MRNRASRPIRSLLLVLGVATSLQAQDGTIPRQGELGQQAPESLDLRLSDTLVAQDDHGGTLQQLVYAGGSAQGFGLLWRDHREGMMGLYLGRFGPDGKLLEPERPVHQPYSGRRLQPGLALAPDGSGIALWTADVLNEPVLFAHAFAASGAWLAPDQPLSPVPDQPRERSARSNGVQSPSAAALEGGGFLVAWTIRGALMLAEVGPDGTRKGAPERINPREQQAEPGVQLVSLAKKGTLALWRADGKLWAQSLRAARQQAHDLGALELLRALPGGPGHAWLLFLREGRGFLRAVGADGRLEKEEFEASAPGEQPLDLACLGDQLAVLLQTGGAKPPAAEPARGGRGGRTQAVAAGTGFQLRLVDPETRRPARSLEFLPLQARISGTPLLASDGKRLLVAWTDEREGDPDIFARFVQPGLPSELATDFRANTDRASADQTGYRISCNGQGGLVTWLDKRDGVARAFGRRVAGPGALAGDEFPLTPRDGPAVIAPVQPSVRPDGSFVAAAIEQGGRLRLSVYDAGNELVGAALELEAGGARDCVLLALPAELGWLCLWSNAEPAVWSRRLSPTGELLGERERLSRPSAAAMGNVALIQLGPRRLLAAWDTNDGGWKIRGRFLSLEGAGAGDEFTLEGSPRQQDWDPALAPADGGGFLVAWTSGPEEDPSRDVVARFFDGAARPAGPLLWISPTGNEQDWADAVRMPDGSWVVAWEDDISGYDHTYLRRIQKDQRQLGPILRINERTTKSIEDRVAPRIGLLSGGLACVFGDRRRSLGWDVYLRVLGPKFDHTGKH